VKVLVAYLTSQITVPPLCTIHRTDGGGSTGPGSDFTPLIIGSQRWSGGATQHQSHSQQTGVAANSKLKLRTGSGLHRSLLESILVFVLLIFGVASPGNPPGLSR